MVYFLSGLLFTFCLVVGSPNVYADTSVFFVKKSLKMENDEVSVHDYYINAGTNDGLKRGMVIKVHRKVPFQDTGKIKINEQLEVPIVELKLVHVQGKLSVGRVYRSLIDRSSPILDYSGIMMGDHVNLGSKRWPKRGEKTAGKRKFKKKAVALKPKSKAVEKEGQSTHSSVSPNFQKNAIPQVNQKKKLEEDKRAESVPLGGEFSPTTL